MTIQDRINELQAAVGGDPVEHDLLFEAVVHVGVPGTANPGVNQTLKVVLASGRVGYFKRFGAQSVNTAVAYGHHFLEIPLHEVIAWRLAAAVGPPYDELVPPAALRIIDGDPGALVAEKVGSVDAAAFTDVPGMCCAGGFWDALIGQQDRHMGQFRYDRQTRSLGLIDHGYAFARPGDLLNASELLAFRRLHDGPAVSRREVALLEDLLHSGDLHGLRRFLPPDRADALEARAQRMATSRVLPLPLAQGL